MVINYISAAFMLIGVLMYALSSNGKVQEIGRILFAAGTFAFALGAGNIGLHLHGG